ncbi:hypothetical protein ACF08N_33915 [Streptomyces sp. NPDC015127]|uniref:hypothetical protein n=1 Tax=Streptomyces sp. NPDC015127 TaxID=3364939 RepID=UPI0036F68161
MLHVTSPSILLEDQDWLTKQPEHAFVDPEIGPMCAAARNAGIGFGYLHAISNNSPATTPRTCPMSVTAMSSGDAPLMIDRIRDIIAGRLAARPN